MGVVLLVFLLKEFQVFLRPFIFAVLLTFLFVPLTRLSKKKFYSFSYSAVAYLGILVGLIFVSNILFAGGGNVPASDVGISEKFEELILTEVDLFGNTFSLSNFVDVSKIQEMFGIFAKSLFSSTTSFLSELFLIILFVAFLLPSYEGWVSKVSKNLNNSKKKLFLNMVDEVEVSIRDYLKIKSLISFGTALVSFIILVLFGVNYAFFFAVLIFLLNFIPNIGSFIAVGLIILSELVNSGFGSGLVMLVCLLIIVQIVFGNIIEPKVAGNKFNISPIVVLLSLLFWGSIWGIGGMLFSVPLTVFIKIVFSKIKSFDLL